MSQNVEQAMEILKNAQAAVHDTLKDFPALQTRAKSVLDTLINGLGHTIGKVADRQPEPTNHISLAEAWGFAPASDTTPTKAIVAKSDVDELRELAKAAYETFLDRDSAALAESLLDIELRAVAKLAGLPVTPTEPKTITVPYIEEIKAAIKSKKLLELQQEDERKREQTRLDAQASTKAKKQ